MRETHSPYPPEFKRRLVELVCSGRSLDASAKESEPSPQTVRNWAKQADLDEGRREDDLIANSTDDAARLEAVTKPCPPAGV